MGTNRVKRSGETPLEQEIGTWSVEDLVYAALYLKWASNNEAVRRVRLSRDSVKNALLDVLDRLGKQNGVSYDGNFRYVLKRSKDYRWEEISNRMSPLLRPLAQTSLGDGVLNIKQRDGWENNDGVKIDDDVVSHLDLSILSQTALSDLYYSLKGIYEKTQSRGDGLERGYETSSNNLRRILEKLGVHVSADAILGKACEGGLLNTDPNALIQPLSSSLQDTGGDIDDYIEMEEIAKRALGYAKALALYEVIKEYVYEYLQTINRRVSNYRPNISLMTSVAKYVLIHNDYDISRLYETVVKNIAVRAIIDCSRDRSKMESVINAKYASLIRQLFSPKGICQGHELRGSVA